MYCLLCRESSKLISINSPYGHNNHKIGDYFIEMYGEKVKHCLTSDSCVCNVCLNILENVVKVLKLIWNVISHPDNPAYLYSNSTKLSRFLKTIASLRLEDDDITDEPEDSISTNDLVINSYCTPYHEHLEMINQEKERLKSLSATNFTKSTRHPESAVCSDDENNRENNLSRLSRSDTPYSEISRYTKSQCLLDRSHNVNISVQRRPSSSDESDDDSGGEINREIHNLSRLSRLETCTPRSEATCYTTRASTSKSRAEEEKYHNLFYCQVLNCNMYSTTVENLNSHNIAQHGMFNEYNCIVCPLAYTTYQLLNNHIFDRHLFCTECLQKKKMRIVHFNNIEELNEHLRKRHKKPKVIQCHDCGNKYTTEYVESLHKMKCHMFTVFCLFCGKSHQHATELQKHIDQHMMHSIECGYCDKSFLSSGAKEEHVFKMHKGKKKMKIYNDSLILDQKSYDDENSEELNYNKEEKHYEARYLVQCGLDMTIENLKIQNLPVYTSEGTGLILEGFSEECRESDLVSEPISEIELGDIQNECTVENDLIEVHNNELDVNTLIEET
ncbi:unnamed protein product [Phyllotreta striolata]|uniref:C2H2-type domain-containing protein n=1 Tax=Phyllotreta striolata TaxID=444603 RepID=A0A9N9XMQ2_PHYSR|nr:unnamed protein product [Phyllotreta striolata]